VVRFHYPGPVLSTVGIPVVHLFYTQAQGGSIPSPWTSSLWGCWGCWYSPPDFQSGTRGFDSRQPCQVYRGMAEWFRRSLWERKIGGSIPSAPISLGRSVVQYGLGHAGRPVDVGSIPITPKKFGVWAKGWPLRSGRRHQVGSIPTTPTSCRMCARPWNRHCFSTPPSNP
jgi:hypothetical protein